MVLNRGDVNHLPSLLDLLNRDVRDTDMADDSSVDVVPDGTDAVLQRDLRVRLVQVVEADRVRPEPAKALLDLARDHVGPAIAVAALRRHDASVRCWRERSSDRLLALAAGIGMRGIDQVDAGGHRLADELDVLRCLAQTIGPEPDPGHRRVAEGELRRRCR